jgi:basic membrane protein A
MRKSIFTLLVVVSVLSLALSACGGGGGTAKLKVGLVTDVGGVNDKSFNQSAWAGVQKAVAEMGAEAKFIESKQPTDYEKNIDQFATEKYDVIITVGFMMGDATAVKALQYPNIKFAIIDNAYYPTAGAAICDDTKKDCYDDGGLKNVTSLMFQEDEVGYLAGVLAAGMSKTGTICSVSGMEIPPVVRFVVGYQNGAKWMKSDVKTLNVYIPSFTDPAKGKETGESMIGQGCDVIFGVGGNTGNGGLLAAKEKGLMAIGVDVDQYNTYPEVKDALISSAAKNVDAAVYNYLKAVSGGTAKAGIFTANLQNGGVGLAPYHDWDSKIPQSVKDKVKEATDGLKGGSLTTGYTP